MISEDQVTKNLLTMQFGSRRITSENKAFIMGIVNVTPDSFYSESRGGIERAEQLISDGADILDIGGESTRPGYTAVDDDEEIKRVVPVITEIRKKYTIPISIDTTKYSVLKAAYEAGADIFNDISSFDYEDGEKCADFVAQKGMSVILMHRFTEPEEKRVTNPKIVEEVSEYLEKKVAFALGHGTPLEKIIVDPGIGFGKSFEENVLLIKNTQKLCNGKYPILMALSRKRCIGTITGRTVEERLAGTLAANMLSIKKGAVIVRVHDVAETKDALNIMKYLS